MKRFYYNIAGIPPALKLCLPLPLYLTLTLLYFGKTGSWTTWDFGDGGDGPIFVWFLNWWSFAASHGLNLFITKSVWYPHGFNLTWATSVPSAALIGLPFSLIGGPIFAFNILSVAAPALSAWTCFLLCRQLTGDWKAALAGGYIFGFSSYELGQMLGHLNLDETFLVPVVILLCIRRFHAQLGRTRFVILLALALLLQLGFSTEILTTLCAAGAMTWLIFLVHASSPDRKRLGILAADVVLAGLASLALGFPFILYLIKGLPDVPLVINSPIAGSADFTNFFIPTRVTGLGKGIFSAVSQRFVANNSEAGGYLGIPLIVLMLLFAKDNIGKPYARALTIVTGMIILLSMGPVLQIAGAQTAFLLPWFFVEKLPIIGFVLPVRLTMYVALCAGVTSALFLAQKGTNRRIGRFLLAGTACFFLAPNLSYLGWTRWPEQPFFTKENITKLLGPAANVVILPLPPASQGMVWQMNAGMRFSQSGGYVGFIPRREADWNVIQDLIANVASPDFSNDLTGFCAIHGVQYLIVTPATSPSIRTAIAMLNWPEKLDHGVNIVQVPPASALHFYHVDGAYWPGPSPFSWIGQQIAVVTQGETIVLTLKGLVSPQPVLITASSKAGTKVYEINQTNEITIKIPADSTMTLTASHTVSPDALYHTGDKRHLSVTLGIEAFTPGAKKAVAF